MKGRYGSRTITMLELIYGDVSNWILKLEIQINSLVCDNIIQSYQESHSGESFWPVVGRS